MQLAGALRVARSHAQRTGEDAPDTPLLSYLLQRALLAHEEEQELVAQEYEELDPQRLRLYFLDTGSGKWKERLGRSEAAQDAR